MKSDKPAKKTLDDKLADFFNDDPVLKKYGNPDIEEQNEFFEKLSELRLGLISMTKTIARKAVALIRLGLAYLRRVAPKTKRIAGGVTVFVLVVSGMLIFSKVSTDTTEVQGASTGSNQQSAAIFTIPADFVVVTSAQLSADDLAYDSDKQVVSIPGKLGEANIVISQQKVDPVSSSKDNFLLGVAQSFGISREVQSNYGPVFLGENENQSIGTIVFKSGEYLFFMRTDSVIEDSRIVEFINNLQI